MQRQFILFLILSLIVSIFVLSNAEVMTVRLFFWSFELSGSLVILLALALGALLVYLLGLSRYVRQILRTKDLEKQLLTTQQQLKEIQTLSATQAQEIETLKAEVNQLSLEQHPIT